MCKLIVFALYEVYALVLQVCQLVHCCACRNKYVLEVECACVRSRCGIIRPDCGFAYVARAKRKRVNVL